MGTNTPFITTWKLSPGTSTSITLPLCNPNLYSSSNPGTTIYNFNVNWGDNTNSNITASNWSSARTHSYTNITTTTEITIRITGVIRSWSFYNTNISANLITSVKQWGCLHLINIPRIINLNGGIFTTLGNFNNCLNLTLYNVTDVLNL